MAIAVGSVSNTPLHGSRTNTTITAPTGITNGDLLVAVLFVGHASALPLLTVTPPTGWTEVANSPSGVDAPDPYEVSIRVYTKPASGESGDYTFTHAAAETQGYMYRLTGASTSTPVDATPAAAVWSSLNGQTTTYGSVTTVTNGCFLIFAEADWDGPGSGTVSGTTPSIAVRRAGTVTWLGDGTQTTAGATSSRTRANGNASVQARWASIVVPIRPATGGGSTTPQTVSATCAAAVAVVKRANKAVSAACSDVTTVSKQVGKAVAATSATVESVIKRAGKGISAVSATSSLANATRAFLKTVSATLTGSVSVSRQARKIASATSTTATAVRKAVGKPIAVASSAAGAIAKRAGKTLAATSSSLASVTARAAVTIAKTVTISCASGVSLTKAIAKRVSATLSLSALVNAVLSVIIPSPIDPRRKAGAAATAEGRTLAALAETRVAQTSGEYRAVIAPEERRTASAQQERPRTAAPTSTGRRNTV